MKRWLKLFPIKEGSDDKLPAPIAENIESDGLESESVEENDLSDSESEMEEDDKTVPSCGALPKWAPAASSKRREFDFLKGLWQHQSQDVKWVRTLMMFLFSIIYGLFRVNRPMDGSS